MIDKIININKYIFRLIKGIWIGKHAGLSYVQIHAVRKCYSENTLDVDDIESISYFRINSM